MMTEKTAYQNLLCASETLLERREDQMVTEVEWDALRDAIAAARLHAPGSDDGLVPLECACPKCGQRCMDHLVWLNPDNVRCQVCRTTYEPHAEKEPADDHSA